MLKNLEIELPFDPANPLMAMHREESRIERNTCIPMFIPALFSIVGYGSNLDVHYQTNLYDNCDTYKKIKYYSGIKNNTL